MSESNRAQDSLYARGIKRGLDAVLSLGGVVVLSPLYLGLAAAIKLDSPGPVFFRQKRVGIDKTYFEILKFRTMRIDTPHDVPTHLLENPDQWITRVGHFLRKTSLDELPQIFNILAGQMSIIGPRPALWNQYDLIAERDKYGANDVRPGLTGWAQINGRDELEIAQKARLDGEYVKNMSFGFDVRCFFGTIGSVLRGSGVVEGGTGEMKKQKK
jgi:O-antigen biosynthesis protein WbqP